MIIGRDAIRIPASIVTCHKTERDRHQLSVFQEDVGEEELVPYKIQVYDCRGRKDRLGNRNDDFVENLESGRSVKDRRLLKLPGNSEEI